MGRDELKRLFLETDGEFLKFGLVESPRSRRRDLHAFLLLDELQPSPGRIIGAAEHDEIWLDVDVEKLAALISPAQVIELIRCGARYDDDNDSLAMYA